MTEYSAIRISRFIPGNVGEKNICRLHTVNLKWPTRQRMSFI